MHQMNVPDPCHKLIHFWFGEISDQGEVAESVRKRWWEKSVDFDSECRAQFGEWIDQAKRGELSDWQDTSLGLLAFILLCDQIPRNVHRGTPRAFETDALALAATMHGQETGKFVSLLPVQRAFAYMPLMHAEDPEAQELSILCFNELKANNGPDHTQFAISHKKIIDRFGRYPHRNEILGRESTVEEIAFLQTPGSSF